MPNLFEDFFNKNREFIKKVQDVAYDATIGLVKNYQQKTVTLAKLHAAQVYMKFVLGARKQIMTLALGIFCAVLGAVGLIVIPVQLILQTHLSNRWKFGLIAGWGVLTVLIPLVAFLYIFSEKAWIKFSKSQKFMDDIISEG